MNDETKLGLKLTIMVVLMLALALYGIHAVVEESKPPKDREYKLLCTMQQEVTYDSGFGEMYPRSDYYNAAVWETSFGAYHQMPGESCRVYYRMKEKQS